MKGRVALAALLFASASLGCTKDAQQASVAAFDDFKDPSAAPLAIRTAAQAVVRISTEGSYATGSFLSADGLLLTNNHVLGVDVCPREGCFAKLTFSHQRHTSPPLPSVTVFVQPLHVDVGLDMALVQTFSVSGGQKGDKLATPNFLAMDAQASSALLGRHVHVVGHPEGRLKKWTSGDVALIDGQWFWTTAFSLPGNSGSPILGDDGRIVGILHRGPTTEDLVTQTGVETYTIASASAPLVAAMAVDLPAAMRSVAATVTDDDVVARSTVYLNARVPTANVNGTPKDVLVTLGEACDKALARSDFASPNDLDAALGPCTSAASWIDCRSDKDPETYGVCPADPAAWTTRFRGVFDRWRALNGTLELTYVSFAVASLGATKAAGADAATAALTAALNEAQPPPTFRIASYMASQGVAAYAGMSALDYVRNYSTVPHYELSLNWIVSAELWLNSDHLISGDDTIAFLKRVAADPKIDLSQKLYIEEVQYNSSLLD